jgi:prepilin-type processing-associated H-X9-DG protein
VANPDGRYAHNVWDEQIRPHVKSADVYRDENAGPGIRSWSDPGHERVVTYGLNGLLITPPRAAFDGRADFRRPPAEPQTLVGIANPAATILFAEVMTEAPMPGEYGQRPDPVPFTYGDEAKPGKRDWRRARDGWIDVSPRDFVENTPAPGAYDEGRWNARSGVARNLYGGGGTYGFVDGHVKFMKIAETLSARDRVPMERYWSPDNEHNMWNPDH